MQKASFSSCRKTKVRHLRHAGSARAKSPVQVRNKKQEILGFCDNNKSLFLILTRPISCQTSFATDAGIMVKCLS